MLKTQQAYAGWRFADSRELFEAAAEASRDASGAVTGRMTVVKNKSGESDVSIATRMYGDSNLIV